MSNFVSQEISRRLYELSGWGGHLWYQEDEIDGHVVAAQKAEKDETWVNLCPAYETDYLLRQLAYDGLKGHLTWGYESEWVAGALIEKKAAARSGASPEDALAQLCITLFEAGVFKP